MSTSNVTAADPWGPARSSVDELLQQASSGIVQILTGHDVVERSALVRHALSKAREHLAEVAVLYVQSTKLEADFAAELLKAADPAPLRGQKASGGQVGVLTYAEFCALEGARHPGSLVVFLDTEISESGVAILALDALLDRIYAAIENEPTYVVAMGCFGQAYKHVAEHVAYSRVVHVGVAHLAVDWAVLDLEDTQPVVEAIQQCRRHGKRVVSFLDEAKAVTILGRVEGSDTIRIYRIDASTDLAQARDLFRVGQPDSLMFISVDPAVFSSPLPFRDVGLVLSSLEIERPLMNRETGLLVYTIGRLVSRQELQTQHGYAQGAPLYCCYTADDAAAAEERPPARYLSEDMMSFVFRLVCQRHANPPRPGASQYTPPGFTLLFKTMAYRLECMGLVECREAGIIPTPDNKLKEHMLAMLARYPHSFNGARLLAGLYGLPDDVKRILIRIGALMCLTRPSGNLIDTAVDEEMDEESLKYVRQECWGYTSELCNQGSLWIALGLWEQTRARTQNFQTKQAFFGLAEEIVPVDVKLAEAIFQDVTVLETMHSLEPATKARLRRKLSQHELALIHRHLAWAWQDKLVMLPLTEGGVPFELTSYRKVQPTDDNDLFCFDDEPCNPSFVRQPGASGSASPSNASRPKTRTTSCGSWTSPCCQSSCC